ncbi:hypothetical protein [Vulcanisaeta sp. JCM 16159]|uniref:hypothetical protein n=1 Tax=Vulcanisaeta sp. JCM 16159 TaxID=1295371 RepID=UPI001FB33BA6|nr:hypothetical protein [Vulcanisaeta sp. JCM 16159]
MCEAKGFYAFYVVEIVPAALIILFMRDLVNLILGIMIFNAIALAIPTYLLIGLASRKDVVGDYAIGRARAIVLYIVTTALIIAGAYAVVTAV